MSSNRRSYRSSRSTQATLGGVLACLGLLVAGFACRIYPGNTPPYSIDTPDPLETPSLDWFRVYFTDPDGPNANTYRGGPDTRLAAAIDSARLSVDVAVFDLDLWSVRDALLHAQRRGVQVRLVTDSDNIENEEVQQLKDAGIPVLGDRRESLMHNKFVVIDRQEVWSGSMNYTVSDGYKNNNNLIRIRSSRLAEDYITEFEEMFTDDKFGPGSPADTPYPSLMVEGTQLEVYYSPDDGVAAHLVNLIHAAQQSIYFLAYSFTSDDIADAMLSRARDGVAVSGVFEESQVNSNQGGEYDRLRNAGLDVRLDTNPSSMHHKVILIDGQIVISGSYNFSASAELKNDENVLIIYNPQIATLYIGEYNKIFERAKK